MVLISLSLGLNIMSEKPRYVIRKWVENTFVDQLDRIERRTIEAIFMNIKSLRCVKYVTLTTDDLFKAGLHMSFKDLRLTIWALFGETVLLPGLTGGYRVLASVLIDENKEEIRVCPSLHLLEMRTGTTAAQLDEFSAVNDEIDGDDDSGLENAVAI